MSTLAEVRLWNTTIGSVLLGDSDSYASFEYDASFAQSGIQVAPLVMPLSRSVYRFPNLAYQTFHGLPGMLADCLPDRFGNALIDAWLSRTGRSSFNAVERLCYTGKRGIGALEFYPLIEQDSNADKKLEIASLVNFASEILKYRENFRAYWNAESSDNTSALSQILSVGTSAGGARAKAVIAWNPRTNEVRSGQIEAEGGFQYWIMKFDGVTENKDKELADPKGYTNIEFAYYLMAREAGINMSECRLFTEGMRQHFMTKRFDRTDDGDKIHMQSLGALAHFDFNSTGAYSYESVFPIIRSLDMPVDDVEQFFRRMVFNILARNQDDHVKNIAFLMDRFGNWQLAPAYDVTFSFQKGGLWTGRHQMSMNGKRDDFIIEDFKQCEKTAGLPRGRAEETVREISAALQKWPQFAEKAHIAEKHMQAVQAEFRKI
jgi:serine/threonine-protein kinase HipA